MRTLLAVAMIGQFRARRYAPSIYWTAVVLVSVVGTLITDNLTDHFGVPLQLSAGIFAAALAVTFAAWFSRASGTLSIHTIFTAKREALYWAAIVFTFALGTAGGDLMAETMQLGYLNSALIFGGGIALVTAAYFAFRLNAILASTRRLRRRRTDGRSAPAGKRRAAERLAAPCLVGRLPVQARRGSPPWPPGLRPV